MDVFRIFHRFEPVSWSKLVLLAVAVGVGAGGGAVVFRSSILVLQSFLYQIYPGDDISLAILDIPWWMRLVIPAFGGLLVGAIVYFGKFKEVQGHGVPEVMESFVKRKGKMRLIIAPTKALLSAITIASGGATGREGPIVQIGAAIGSSLGQTFRLRPEYVKVLLAAGAAAGIGGTFNAPLAGVVFAWEVLFPKIQKRYLGVLLIASLVGTVFANSIIGFQVRGLRGSVFQIPSFEIINSWEFLLYGVLGLLAAFVGATYIRVLYTTEDFFEDLPVPVLLKPALGGLLVGVIALMFPQIFGFASYSTIEGVLNTSTAPLVLITLLIAKLLATSITLGSGGSGGVFAPALYLGAMLGGAFGGVFHGMFPASVSASPSYAVVGIGAVFAAAAHAPFSAIIIIVEMTSWPLDSLIPISLACWVSYRVTKYTHARSIYTEKLHRKHIRTKDFG